MVLPEEARRTRAEAERLGLFGLAKLGKRKVTTNGTSPSVNLGEYLAEIGAHTGDTLDVGVRGDTIVLRKGTAKASSRKPSGARRR